MTENQQSQTQSETDQLLASLSPEFSLDDPQATLDHIRQKMESVAEEFGNGKLNRAQFNAIYGHYNEQRTIIETIITRNPENDAWRQVAKPGKTTFLRAYFEAQPVFYIVFKHHVRSPLISAGEHPEHSTPHIVTALKYLWHMETMPTKRLARKEIDNGQWLILAIGEQAITVVVYSMQPSNQQAHLIRDLHDDFESANRLSLKRNQPATQMVFPQRALLS